MFRTAAFSLNLLDPAHRRAIMRERFMLIIKDITIMTLGAVALIAIVLTASKAALSNNLQESAVRANIVSSKNQPVQKAIRELNGELQGVEAIIDEYTAWSDWFSAFSARVPQGIQMRELAVNRQDRTVAFAGKSRKRDDLLKFKQNLESSGLFKELQFPLSNLLLREQIDFEFSATLYTSSLNHPRNPPSP